MKRTLTLLLGLSLVMTACGSSPPNPPTVTMQPAIEASTPTPVLACQGDGCAPGAAPAQDTATPPPLRFVVPSPGAEPVSGWRPPLYPLPWAIAPHDHFYFARPIAANEVNWPLADYRYGGVFFRPNVVHTGVDIPAEEGTPVLAAGPGTVIWAGWGLFTESPSNSEDPYGRAVAIRHDFGYQGQPLYTIYAHMLRVKVTLGQWVDTGDQLGLVGHTGFTTGPHLHFEVRMGYNSFFATYNPELWIAPPQGWGVLAARIMDKKGELLGRADVYIQSLDSGQKYAVKTYGGGATNSDPYYQENMVISDLPAGDYEVLIDYAHFPNKQVVHIHPGQITYFTFQGQGGFETALPPTPGIAVLTPTATPKGRESAW